MTTTVCQKNKIKMWTLFYKSIPSAISQSVIHYIKCHHHHTLSVKRVKKTPAPEGPSQLTRPTATQSTPIYCINSVTSGDIWSFYLSTDCITV